MYFLMRRYDDKEWVYSTHPIQIDNSFLDNNVGVCETGVEDS